MIPLQIRNCVLISRAFFRSSITMLTLLSILNTRSIIISTIESSTRIITQKKWRERRLPVNIVFFFKKSKKVVLSLTVNRTKEIAPCVPNIIGYTHPRQDVILLRRQFYYNHPHFIPPPPLGIKWSIGNCLCMTRKIIVRYLPFNCLGGLNQL